jgi:hypothetical protein
VLVSASITRIRKLIRDTGSSTFSDARLLRLYNLARRRFFRETLLSTKDADLPNPPDLDYGGSQLWEANHRAAGEFFWFPFIYEPVGPYACTQPWEATTLQDSDSGDVAGGYLATVPSDISEAELINVVPHPFPADFHDLIYMAWDSKNIYAKSKEWIMSYDRTSWMSKQSDGVLFYYLDEGAGQKQFVPYPRPTDIDTTSAKVYYRVVPQDHTATTATETCPRPFIKYIEFLVASLALKAETERKDTQRSQLYGVRYAVGVRLVKTLKAGLRSGRTYRHEALGEGYRWGPGRQRPRLPAGYPRIW